MELLMTPTEAAKSLAVSRSMIYRLLASGEMPSVRIRTSVRVPVEGLRAWVAAQTASAEASKVA